MAPIATKKIIATPDSAGFAIIGSENADLLYSTSSSVGSLSKKTSAKVSTQTEEIEDNTATFDENLASNQVYVHVYQEKKEQRVSHSLVTQKWEGIIKEVNQDEGTFIAHLYKIGGSAPDVIEGEFDFEDVPKDDRSLIAEGVFFYWILGREITKGGQITNAASVMIRRLPSWKRFDLNKSSQKTDEFYSFFAEDDTQYPA